MRRRLSRIAAVAGTVASPALHSAPPHALRLARGSPGRCRAPRAALLAGAKAKRLLELEPLQRAHDAFTSAAGIRKLQCVLGAKVPILKFERDGVPVDLCLNRVEGVVNSLLMRIT